MIRSIAQVNVRLSEGGAAGVARAIANGLEQRGIASPFVYGYGPGGGDSPLDAEYDSLRLTSMPVAGVNRLAYRTIGRETELRSRRKWKQLSDLIAGVDIVHLHAIHTFFVSTRALFGLLRDAGKPVVWTFHDQWAMTGRCAQPAGCTLWETGCSRCPDLKAYPEAWMDHAGRRWKERRRLIAGLQAEVPTAIVACADWLGEAAARAGFENVHTVTNSLDTAFWSEATSGNIERRAGSSLFVCRDLRDPQKVDWDVLGRVADIPDQRLTIVGDNAPIVLPGVEYLPAIGDRAELARLMRGRERLIFTSKVDYYPLTVAEAVTAGMDVYAVDSPAARELAAHGNVRTFADPGDLVEAMTASTGPRSGDADASAFQPGRMIDDYVRIYEDLVQR